MLRNLGSDHQPIQLTVSLFPVFCSNKHPPSFSFQETRWDDFAFHFDSHYPSAEEKSSLSLFSAALFISLTINEAESFVFFGRIKSQSKAWCFAEIEKAVSERLNAFAAACRRDEDCQAYISASRHASFVIAKTKANTGQATFSFLKSKSDLKSVYFLCFVLSLALLLIFLFS